MFNTPKNSIYFSKEYIVKSKKERMFVMKKLLSSILALVIISSSMCIALADDSTTDANTKFGQRIVQQLEKLQERGTKINEQESKILASIQKLKEKQIPEEAKALLDEIIALHQKLVSDTLDLRSQQTAKIDSLIAVLSSETTSKEDKIAALKKSQPEIKALAEQIKAIIAPIHEQIKAKNVELRAIIKANRPDKTIKPTTPAPTATPSVDTTPASEI